jgi:hypothetical protein
MTTPLAPSPRLEYAPAAPVRRRKIIRRALAMIVIAAVGYVAVRHGTAIRSQAKLLYLQRQCLRYTAPADQIVFTNDPADAPSLLRRPGYQPLLGWGSGAAPPTLTGHVPPSWGNFTSAAAIPALSPTNRAAVVFCGERVSRTGVRRLVVIERTAAQPHYPYNPLSLDVRLVAPAEWTGRPMNRTPIYPIIRFTGTNPIEPVPTRIYAGQADPADAARFTIRFSMNGRDAVVEGRLNDDGKDVTFASRLPATGATQ